MDDMQAIQRLKKGDIGGLEILVARYQAKAVRVAFLITHDEALAEDVVQDTFVRFHHQIGGFDSTRPFEPYLLQSVVNAALNVARKSDSQEIGKRLKVRREIVEQSSGRINLHWVSCAGFRRHT